MLRTFALGVCLGLTALPAAAQTGGTNPGAPPAYLPPAVGTPPAAVPPPPPPPAGTPCPCPSAGCDPWRAVACPPVACPPVACPPATACPPACPPPRSHPVLDRLRADPCSKPREYWVSGEYLLWNIRNAPVGDVAAVAPPGASLGVLAANPTLAAPAGGAVDYGTLSGFRVSGGVWWGRDCDTLRGWEVSGFLLPRQTAGYVPGAGGAALVRPFTDLRTFTPNFAAVALPGTAAGTLAVDASARLWGTETNLVVRVDEGRGLYYDLLAGVRYLELDEDLVLSQASTLAPGAAAGFAGRTVTAPATLGITDAYRTSNKFVGGQLGNRVGVRLNRWTVEGYGKVALGWVREGVDLNGATLLTGAGPAALVPGGLLVVPGNAGHTTVDDFAVVPEFGGTVGYRVTNWLRLTAGYSALYWGRLARPGDQMSAGVNPNQVPASQSFGQPGGAAMAPGSVARTHLWVSGVSFGAVFTY